MQPVQINIYQSNTYKKGFSWSHLDHEPRVQERQQVFDQHSYNHVSAVYLIYPNRSQEQQPSHCNSVPSKAVCQIYSDKEQHQDKETLQNESMHLFSCRQFQQQRTQIQIRRERQSQHLKRCFSSRAGPFMFTSIAPVLLDRPNKTS